jgi:isopentenyl phosphate kinase
MDSPAELVFLKLGGSLITHKSRAYTARRGVIERVAGEIRRASVARPALRLVLGHGSGSFGHQAAAPYGTRAGVHTRGQWVGFAGVAAAAARLNRIVTDGLLAADVPVWSLQPSASAHCRDGLLVRLETDPIRQALERGLVPLVYGDVALDEVRGGTIVSTEDLFVYLAGLLRPNRILLAGAPEGVLDASGHVIPSITPATLPTLDPLLKKARETDVTGGMADKVARMVGLVQEQPGLEVRIFSGLEPGQVRRVLEAPELAPGTLIHRA